METYDNESESDLNVLMLHRIRIPNLHGNCRVVIQVLTVRDLY